MDDAGRRRPAAGPGAVSWDTAERVAGWVGGRSRVPAPYRPDLLQAEFDELTAQAEELVADRPGCARPPARPGPG